MSSAQPLAHAAPLLAVRDLEGWYGDSHVLHGINFDVAEGEVVTLLGRNGAGKTTTLKAIMGILAKRKGSVVLRRARIDLAAIPRNRPGRYRVVPGRAGNICILVSRGKSDAAPTGQAGRVQRRSGVRALP